MQKILLALLLLPLLVWAGPEKELNAAVAAYKHGEYAKSFSTFKSLADTGDARAQFYLGESYSTGRGVKLDYAEATQWYRQAAEQGHGEAQLKLGFNLIWGVGTPYRTFDSGHTQQKIEAEKWFGRAREAADDALNHGNYEQAFRIYMGLAEWNPTLRDMKIVAYMSYNGLGVQRNLTRAADYWGRAARRGDAGAQVNLGVVYTKGHGVQKDYVEAYAWLDMGARSGSENGRKSRDNLKKMMTPEQIQQGQARSDKLWESYGKK